MVVASISPRWSPMAAAESRFWLRVQHPKSPVMPPLDVPPTPAETATLRQLAIQWLTDYGLDKQLLQRGSTRQAISAVLRESAGRALIGRFDVESKHAILRLFAIAERDRGQYRLTLANLEIQHNVEDGTDKTERTYVDQLDIDNDGQDEVITSASHSEAWSYAVWKFNANARAWREKYKALAGGC